MVMTARLIPEASINTAQTTGHGGLRMSSNADLSKRIETALLSFVKAVDATYVEVMRGADRKPTVTS